MFFLLDLDYFINYILYYFLKKMKQNNRNTICVKKTANMTHGSPKKKRLFVHKFHGTQFVWSSRLKPGLDSTETRTHNQFRCRSCYISQSRCNKPFFLGQPWCTGHLSHPTQLGIHRGKCFLKAKLNNIVFDIPVYLNTFSISLLLLFPFIL